MKLLWVSALGIGASLLMGCPGNGEDGADLCVAGEEQPTITLGQGVGGAFLAYAPEEEVGLDVAPQGGFGVTVIIQTTGLSAGPDSVAQVQLNVEEEGSIAGEFTEPGAALRCTGEEGGLVNGLVVGFDPEEYATNDDLIELNGKIVDLVVTVTDPDGLSATARQPVTIVVGG